MLFVASFSEANAQEALDSQNSKLRSELLQRRGELLQVLTVREREVQALKIAQTSSADQDQKKLIQQQLDATQLNAQHVRILLAANQLLTDGVSAKPELRNRIEEIADQMTNLKGQPDAAQMRNAETLRIVANLLFASAYFRDIGNSAAADRITKEADRLEESISDVKR